MISGQWDSRAPYGIWSLSGWALPMVLELGSGGTFARSIATTNPRTLTMTDSHLALIRSENWQTAARPCVDCGKEAGGDFTDCETGLPLCSSCAEGQGSLPGAECFCVRLFDCGHGAECGLIESIRLERA